MNILVTGGLGSVGRPLVELLVKNGHTVKVIGRRPEAEVEAELIPGAAYSSCDINDFSAIRQQVRGMDTVIHLAAIAAPMMASGDRDLPHQLRGHFQRLRSCRPGGHPARGHRQLDQRPGV